MHGAGCQRFVAGVPELQLAVVIIEDVIRYRCYGCQELIDTPKVEPVSDE